MFTNIKNKIRKVQSFDVKAHTLNIIQENEAYLTSLLKSQLRKGEDKYGEPVTVNGRPEYALYTIVSKRRIKGLGGEIRWITNYMSGSFYAFMQVETKGTKFAFTSNVEYFDEIVKQSGEEIIELSEENLLKFKEEILIPELQQRYRAHGV